MYTVQQRRPATPRSTVDLQDISEKMYLFKVLGFFLEAQELKK